MRKQTNAKSCNNYLKRSEENSASMTHCYSTEKKTIYQQLLEKNINQSQLINRNFLSLVSNRNKAATERAHYNSKRASQDSFSNYYKQKIGQPQMLTRKEKSQQPPEEFLESHHLSVSSLLNHLQFAKQTDTKQVSPRQKKIRSMTRLEKKNEQESFDLQCTQYGLKQSLKAVNMQKIIVQVQYLEEVIEAQNKEIEELKSINENNGSNQQVGYLQEQLTKLNSENLKLREKCDNFEKRLEQYRIFEQAIETKFKELIQENLKLNEIIYNAQGGSEELFEKARQDDEEIAELRQQNKELLSQLQAMETKKKKELMNQENVVLGGVNISQPIQQIPLRQQVNQLPNFGRKKQSSRDLGKEGKEQVDISRTLDRLKVLSTTLINHVKNIQ